MATFDLPEGTYCWWDAWTPVKGQSLSVLFTYIYWINTWYVYSTKSNHGRTGEGFTYFMFYDVKYHKQYGDVVGMCHHISFHGVKPWYA